jgi:hypothetical protein
VTAQRELVEHGLLTCCLMRPNAPTPMPPSLLKGLLDVLRVQAHLGAMGFKAAARPWLREIAQQARARARRRRRP